MVTISERLPIFSFGGTVFSGSFKLFSSQDVTQNAINPSVSITQNIQLSHGAGLSFTLLSDYNRARSTFYDRKDYRITSSLYLPQFLAHFDLSLIFDLTFVDTMNQFVDRGLEKTFSPSIILSQTYLNHFFYNINYNYTNNSSLNQQIYAYSKHVFGFGLGYLF